MRRPGFEPGSSAIFKEAYGRQRYCHYTTYASVEYIINIKKEVLKLTLKKNKLIYQISTPGKGFEPLTSTLGGWHSIQLSYPGTIQGTGFEPAQALSHESLNLARLSTPASLHKDNQGFLYQTFL